MYIRGIRADYHTSRYSPLNLKIFKDLEPRKKNRSPNIPLDDTARRTVLGVRFSVVGIRSFRDGKVKAQCSGTVIEFDRRTGRSVVLTSSSLFENTCDPSSLPNYAVKVYFLDQSWVKGEAIACDPHWGIAILSIESERPIVPFRVIKDSVIQPQTTPGSSYSLQPGDIVIAVGRLIYRACRMTDAGGLLSAQRCTVDCNALLRGTMVINKLTVGGPVINTSGELIGMTFAHDKKYTPFLPSNIILKWLDHFRTHKGFFHPSLGMKFTNLSIVELRLQMVIRDCSRNVWHGVVVNTVKPESPAGLRGLLHQDDIIVECDGTPVRTILELFEVLWDKATQKEVNLLVIRPCKYLRSKEILVTLPIDPVQE